MIEEDVADEVYHLATYEDPHHLKISQKPDLSQIDDEQVEDYNESSREDTVPPCEGSILNCPIERCEILYSSQAIESCSIKKSSN